jgi:aldehyde:ferredoxin oxidoreductase
MQPILRINLTSGSIETVTIPQEWEQEFIGGASLAARMLYDHLVQDLDPFSPEAPLLFLNGPLSGTSGPAVGRFVVCGRSPATRLWAESNCGGFWGPELRMAGFDGLWIEGCAEHPVYLWIRDGVAKIRPADHLWGLDTYQTQTAIEDELGAGKIRLATIGIAGEQLVPFALILCDHGRVAGRTGMGAVMGSKNLKAVAVQGHWPVPVINTAEYVKLRSDANRHLRNDPVSVVARELGTASVAEYMDYLSEMPKRYFQKGIFMEDVAISGAALKDTILAGVSACHACVIACGRVVRLEDGVKRKGPEYETLVGFGPNLWLNDAVFATRMGELCDRYGLDSISTSNIIGLAYHLFETERISLEDTGGLALCFGDSTPVEILIEQIANRENFGALLARGSKELARRFGAEEDAVQVNGLELAYHDPRGASGMALVYATSPRGGCHNQSDYFMVEIGHVDPTLGMEFHNRLGGGEKARNVAIHQDWRTVFNSLVICIFSNIPPDSLVELVNAACGYQWRLKDLLLAGERGWNLKRMINHRLGLTRSNDRLPKAMLTPYDDVSPHDQFAPDIEEMLSVYYESRGWDPDTGIPTIQKLTELNLTWTVEGLLEQK